MRKLNYRLPPYLGCSQPVPSLCQSHYNAELNGVLTYNLIATSSVGVTSSLDSYVVGDCVYKLQTDESGSPILTNKSQCEMYGWNGAQTKGYWYGIQPFVFPDDNCPVGLCTTDWGAVNEQNYYLPFVTRYLQSDATYNMFKRDINLFDPNDCSHTFDDFTFSSSYTTTVNRDTNEVITTGSVITGSSGWQDLINEYMTTYNLGSRCQILTMFGEWKSAYADGWTEDYRSCQSASFSYNYGTEETGSLVFMVGDNACSIGLTIYNSNYPEAFDSHSYEFTSINATLTTTEYNWSFLHRVRYRDFYVCDDPNNCWCDFWADELAMNTTIKYSVTNSLDRVVNDTIEALKSIDLTNLVQNPLRTDTKFGLLPMGPIMPDYVPYSGSMRRAWFDTYYDKNHENWQVVDGLWEFQSSGSNSPSEIPHAMRWTEDIDSDCYFGEPQDHLAPLTTKGALIGVSMGGTAGGSVIARKYQQVLIGRYSSHNWLEPFSQSYYSTLAGKNQDCSAGSNGDIIYGISSSYFVGTCESGSGTFNNACGELWYPITNSYNQFWDDTKRKYEFVMGDFKSSTRKVEEDNRVAGYGGAECSECFMRNHAEPTSSQNTPSQSYYAYNPCKPNSVHIGPLYASGSKGETNYKQFDLPSLLIVDGKYESKAIRDVIELMNDPLWQIPAKPCAGEDCADIDWVQDGTWRPAYPSYTLCNEDYTDEFGTCVKWYPFPPQVEARINPPTDECYGSGSAPALPVDSHPFDISNFTPNEFGDSTRWLGPLLPWKLYEKQKACVLSFGRFAEVYSKNCGVAIPPIYPI